MSQAKAETTSRRCRVVAAALVRAVGLVASVVVLAVIVIHAVLMVDRVPFTEYNVTDADRLTGFVLSGWAVAITGLAWLVAMLVAWRKRHLRTRWLAIPPGGLEVTHFDGHWYSYSYVL